MDRGKDISFLPNNKNISSNAQQSISKKKLIFGKISNTFFESNNIIKSQKKRKPKFSNNKIIQKSFSNELIQEIINQKNKQKLKMTLLSRKRSPSKKIDTEKKIKNDTNELVRNSPEQIEEIRNKYYHSSFRFYDKKYKINTTYKYQAESKNYLYFTCSRRPYCHGGCKINKIYSKIEITNRCDPDIQHDILSYDEFLNLYEHKEFDKIDWSIKKHQNMYVAVTFKKKLVTENPFLLELFKKDTGKNLKLRSHEISVIKARIADTCNDLSIEQIIEKLKPQLDIRINSFEVDYSLKSNYKQSTKEIQKNKKGKIIVFATKDMFDNFNNKNIKEFYIDTTFRIIQKKFLNFKIIIITGVDYIKSELKISCFAFIENDDYMSYIKLFQFLNKIYNFNPLKINTDYDPEISKALNFWFDLFKLKPKHKYNFFAYEKFLRERTKTISNNKKEFNLCCLETLINIELISFMDKNNINEMKKVLSEIMKRNYDCNKIFNYIDKNWFSHYLDEINFSKLNLSNYKSELNSELYELYKSKHLSELNHKILDKFIPKYAISMNTFVAQFKKLLRNENIIIPFDFNNFKEKYEYHLQTLIYIINKYNLNQKPKWIEINIYIESLKYIIKENIMNIKGNNYNKQDIINIIKEINYWNVINTSNKNIEELLEDQTDDVLGTRQKIENGNINNNIFGMEFVKNIEKYEKNEIKEIKEKDIMNEEEQKTKEQEDNDIVDEISKILDMNDNNNDIDTKKDNDIIFNEDINKENIENNENSEKILTTKDIYDIYNI